MLTQRASRRQSGYRLAKPARATPSATERGAALGRQAPLTLRHFERSFELGRQPACGRPCANATGLPQAVWLDMNRNPNLNGLSWRQLGRSLNQSQRVFARDQSATTQPPPRPDWSRAQVHSIDWTADAAGKDGGVIKLNQPRCRSNGPLNLNGAMPIAPRTVLTPWTPLFCLAVGLAPARSNAPIPIGGTWPRLRTGPARFDLDGRLPPALALPHVQLDRFLPLERAPASEPSKVLGRVLTCGQPERVLLRRSGLD